MNNILSKISGYLLAVPKKIWLYMAIAGIVVIAVLKFLAAKNATDAKDMNLSALISDAVTNFNIQQNKAKIKELDKKPEKEDLDPKKVEDFYKDRK